MAGRGLGPAGSSCCHSFFPVPASKAYTTSFGSLPLRSAIPVLNTRPAATTGEPMPSPSTADQRTFFVAENSRGSAFFEVETPEQFGPRNCGQSSARRGPSWRNSRAARATVHPRENGLMGRLLKRVTSAQELADLVEVARR